MVPDKLLKCLHGVPRVHPIRTPCLPSATRFLSQSRDADASRSVATPLVLPPPEKASLEVGHAPLADEYRSHKEHSPAHSRQPDCHFPLAPHRDRQKGHHGIRGINPEAQRHQNDTQPKRKPLRWPSQLHNVSGPLPPSVGPTAQRGITGELGSSWLGKFTRPNQAWAVGGRVNGRRTASISNREARAWPNYCDGELLARAVQLTSEGAGEVGSQAEQRSPDSPTSPTFPWSRAWICEPATFGL